MNAFSPPRSSTVACPLLPSVATSSLTVVAISPKASLSLPTVNVLGRFVGVVLYDHLDEVHALNNEPFKSHPLPSRSEDVADGKLQRTMDEWYKCTWVVLQEI